jgi:hypothetical protein
MHNLHFIKVHANSGEEACKLAEQSLLDFGNENNWRTMCGAVSQDNEVYNDIDGRYIPISTDYTTIEGINQCVNEWIKGTFYGETARLKYEKGETNILEWDAIELWSLSKWAEHLSEAYKFKDKSFNVLEDTFFGYKYDECGVSNNSWCCNEGDKIWIVFCDMHS